MFLLFLLLQFACAIEVLPTEIIEDSRIDVFSKRAEVWPNQTVANDLIRLDHALYDSLQKIPSLYSGSSMGSGSPFLSIRGSRESARTLFLYDGIPLSTQDGLGANSLLLPAENIHSLAVLKGPGSVLYGSDAIGGAINLFPKYIQRPVVRTTLGNFEKKSLFLGAPVVKTNDHLVQMSGFLDSSAGNFEYESNSTQLDRTANNSHLQRFNIQGEHHVGKVFIKNHLIYAQNFGASPGPTDQSFPPTYFNRTAVLGSTSVQTNVTEASQLTFRTSYNWSENFNTDTTETRWYVSRLLGSLSYQHTFSNEISTEFFTDLFYDEFRNTPYVTFQHQTTTEPGFILKYSPDTSYYISPGLRYISDQSLFVKSLVVGQDWDSYKVWISYSEGFRRPSFTQKYFSSPTFIGNLNLKPETSSQIELGTTKKQQGNAKTLLDYLSLTGSVYSIEYNDFIEFQSGSPSSYQNISGVDSFGFDIGLGSNYQSLSFLIEYSYLQAENQSTNQIIALAPKQKWTNTFGIQIGPLVTEFIHTHWDPYFISSSLERSAWDTFDLTFRTLGLADWSFRAGLLNLFDQNRFFTVGYPEPGRSLYISLEGQL